MTKPVTAGERTTLQAPMSTICVSMGRQEEKLWLKQSARHGITIGHDGKEGNTQDASFSPPNSYFELWVGG